MKKDTVVSIFFGTGSLWGGLGGRSITLVVMG